MFITPIKPMESKELTDFTSGAQQKQQPDGVFQSVFENAIQNLKDTEAVSQQDAALLASGQVDDLSTLGINSTKAYLAERLVVELRNKALDAYSEIMRINL